MSKPSKIRKPTVELQPSRIRRDPPARVDANAAAKKAYWDPTTWDTWVVVTGVIMFAVALSIITFGISDFTSR